LNQAEVQVRQQRAAYERAEKMWKAGLGPKIDAENSKFAYEQSQANYDLQKVQLDNLTIRAPINGVVTRKNLQLGMLVTTGAPVFSIVDTDSYILEINPPERELPRLHVGQVATVTVDALPGKELTATVRRINPAVENGTVKATLDFDPEHRALLKEGAFARVGLVMETHENALLVPKDALIEENGRRYLFVVKPAPTKDGLPAVAKDDPESAEAAPRLVAERVEVRTGFEDPTTIEIVAGLPVDAFVVTMGQHTLKPNSEVNLTNPEDELAAALAKSPEAALEAAKAERAKGGQPVQGSDGFH
jgi:membrane fusion protein (multidrug efflux system)